MFNTPTSDRCVDDFQPRKNAQKLFTAGKLSAINELGSFSKKFICPVKLVEEYMDHLSSLSTGKEKRKMERNKIGIQNDNKSYADSDWRAAFRAGELKKLTVVFLNSYATPHGLKHVLHMKKKDNIASMLVDSKENDDILQANVISSDDNDSRDCSDSDGDDIICTAVTDDLEEDADEDKDSIQAENLFRETRSGRTATSWRRYQFL